MGHEIYSTYSHMRTDDLEIQGHIIVHATWHISATLYYTCCSNEFGFVSNVSLVRWFIPTTAKCVAL